MEVAVHQQDAVQAVFDINREARRWATARDVAANFDPPFEDPKEAARALLKATRNGRLRRQWMGFEDGPGGCYLYFSTEKGIEWLRWLAGDAAA